MPFPKDFVWGATTVSYQVEGAAYEDGKGPSVWDMFCRREGAIYQGNTGEVACDHYHRYKEDVALMKAIGIQGYRMSISWPRVLPEGVGKGNAAGIDFYDRLIDELLANDVTPYVTLYHWDFPHALYLKGGWLNREVVNWFADYAALMAGKLGDRVKYWMTLNEPAMFVWLGHQAGHHAPGDRLDVPLVLRVAHHVLVAHGKAVQAMRAVAPDFKIGIASASGVGTPATECAEDIQAARDFTFRTYPGDKDFLLHHNFWCDPMLKGNYPEDVLAEIQRRGIMPDILPGDMETIHQPLDFFGLNLYHGTAVRAGENGKPEKVPYPVGYPLTLNYWEVQPESMYWGPKLLYERYRLPVLITENGLSNPDWVSMDGKVHDPQRIDFMRRYLLYLRKVSEEGVPLWGYLHWSLMDNFEWSEGMKQRFGLIHIDYTTQKRTLKDSAYWYQEIIASNGDNL